MALNKKQKKQLDVGKKKLEKLRQLLSAAKQQPDDPGEVTQLETEIAGLDAELKTIRNG